MRSAPIQIRQIFLAFALLALLLRGLVPQGYMPDFGAHGGLIAIRICTGDSHEIIKVSANRYSPSAPAHSAHQNTPCDYAINHISSPAAAAIALLLAAGFLFPAFFTFSKFAFFQRRYFGAMAARAPPVYA